MGLIANSISRAFSLTYPNDDKEFVSPLLLSQLTSFFGLPNGLTKDERSLTWGLIFKNFIGWPATDNSPKKKMAKYLFIPFVTIFHVLQVFLKTFWNTLRLVTEFLPLAVFRIFDEYIQSKVDLDGSLDRSRGSLFLATIIKAVAKLIWMVGRTLTSPIDSAKEMYRIGASRHFLLGVVMGLLSVAVSAAFYVLLFPMAVQALSLSLPTLTTQIGSFLGTHLPWLINAGSLIVSSPVVQGLSTVLVGTVDAIVGAAAVLGGGSLALLFMGHGLKRLFECCLPKRKKVIYVEENEATVYLDEPLAFVPEPRSFPSMGMFCNWLSPNKQPKGLQSYEPPDLVTPHSSLGDTNNARPNF